MVSLPLFLLVAALFQDGAPDPRWDRFRGPEGRGVALGDHDYPVAFGPDTNLLWRCPVGAGLSSPCIWGERIFLTAYEPEGASELETVCFDRATGAVLWRRAVAVERMERTHELHGPASSTPTTDGERVIAYFGSFGLLCHDIDGEELWRRALPVHRNSFGTATSPVLIDGKLVLIRDTDEQSFVEALDPATGETIWRTEREGFASGWSSPIRWRRGGVDELLVFGVWWLTAYDLADGSERWSVPGLSDEPIVTPVTGDGLAFVSSYNMGANAEVEGLPDWATILAELDVDGDGKIGREEAEANESVLSRTDADGEGDHPLRIFFRFLDADRSGALEDGEWQKLHDWLGAFEHANAVVAIRPGGDDATAEIVWQENHGVPECPSPLYHGGRLYLVKNGGTATCLDARTGERKYQARLDTRGPCYASPVLGGGKIYSASARGVVTVFAVGDELEVLARNDLGERILATPALVEGKVYVRSERHLWAFGPGE